MFHCFGSAKMAMRQHVGSVSRTAVFMRRSGVPYATADWVDLPGQLFWTRRDEMPVLRQFYWDV